MSTKTKNYIFLVFVALLIFSSTASVVQTYTAHRQSNDSLLVLSVMQLTGLWAFVLVSLQMVLGVFHQKLIQQLGAKAYRYHIVFGIAGFFLLLAHPVLYGLSQYLLSSQFIDLLVLLPTRPDTTYEAMVNFGRFALYILLFSIVAAHFRSRFFRKNWLKVHYLNYFAYPFILLHSFNLGTHATSGFAPFYFLLAILAGISIVYKTYSLAAGRVSAKLPV